MKDKMEFNEGWCKNAFKIPYLYYIIDSIIYKKNLQELTSSITFNE